MKRILVLFTVLAALAVLPSVASAQDFRDRYEKWTRQTDAQGGTYFQCKYHYPSLNGDSVQYIVWKPNDPRKKNFYLWTSDGTNYWGKCLAPGAPGFNPEKLQWFCYQRLGDATITLALTPGSCPAPNDADPEDGIIAVPPPPR